MAAKQSAQIKNVINCTFNKNFASGKQSFNIRNDIFVIIYLNVL